jgi:parallel beta-helix repeat protein
VPFSSRFISAACLCLFTGSALFVPATRADANGKPDIGQLIREAVKSGQPNLKLPSGTHRLSETLFVKDAHNLVIDGTGVTLVMTNHRQGILYLANCDRLAIRGLTLDYDPLPYVQATITKADRSAFEFTVHDGYPDITPDFSGAPTHLFSAEGKRHSDAFDFYRARIEVLSPRTGLARANGKWPASLAPGDKVVFDRRELDHTNAVEIRNNTGPVLLEDITLLSSPTLGFAGRYSEAPVTFRRVTLKPGPLPSGATEPRLFSSNADAINFIGCRQGPIIENCDLSGQGDDSLNIHGMFLPVARVLSPTRFLTAYPYGVGGFVKPLRSGDALRLYSPGDFAPAGAAVLASLTPLADAAGITAADITPLYPSYKSSKFTVYQVDLAAPATVTAGQWFDIPAINGNGYIVHDSYFHDHRGRGLRLMASDGLVENNRFERLTKSAVSIGPELGFWREAGWVKNLRITGNTLRDIGVDQSLAADGSYVPGAIGIFVRNDIGKAPYPAGNDNIVIENNTIDGSSVAGIHAYAVRGVVIRNNTLRNTNLVRKAGTTDPTTHLLTSGPISIDSTSAVTLKDNTLLPERTAR